MSEHSIELQKLAEEFESCQKILLALGDENRQHLIVEMMRMGECDGVCEYTDDPLSSEVISAMRDEIENCNQESGLHIQLVTDEPKAFDGIMVRYGKFSGVRNYIALFGKKDSALHEKCGYYGERLVLKAQQLGMNTCWVAMTYSKIKTAFSIEKDEKLCVVISLGYGETQGVPHKSKTISEVVKIGGQMPDWFKNGMEAALLAPTAMNQQKFAFTLDGNKVTAKAGKGFYTKIDLGIVKYHFELGAGKEAFQWNNGPKRIEAPYET